MLPPPAPVVTITEDAGGYMDQYALVVNGYVVERVQRVRIAGPCLSACTLVLALPRGRICVGPDAELGFHQSFMTKADKPDPADVNNRSAWGTRMMLRAYPRRVRDWIDRNGGLTARMIFLRGAQLRRLFHTCED